MLHPAFFRGPAARDKAFRRNAQPAPAWSCSGGLGAVHQQAILRSKIAECVPLCIACQFCFSPFLASQKRKKTKDTRASSVHLTLCSILRESVQFFGNFQNRFFSESIHVSIASAKINCCLKTAIPVSGISGTFSFAWIFSSR